MITKKCNLNCSFCNVPNSTADAQYKDVKEALNIMNNLSDFIILSGGEALLYKPTNMRIDCGINSEYNKILTYDIYDVIHYLDSINSNFTLITNGKLLDHNTIISLQKAGLKNITVSIDSFKGIDINIFNILKNYFDDISASIIYEKGIVGHIYDLVKELTDINVWSIISSYNYTKDDGRDHLIFTKELDDYSLANCKYDIDIDIKKILDNFEDLLIHNSKEYIKNIDPYIYNMDWHCKHPYRLVVDNNLDILACEDTKLIKPLNIFELYELYKYNQKSINIYYELFAESISKCNGCYMSCAYEAEALSSLELVHKGGKNVNLQNTGLKLCVRANNREVDPSESHICWFCGADIKIESSVTTLCKKCGLMKCPSCGKCFCDATEDEAVYLRWINKNYCCDEYNLTNLNFIQFMHASNSFVVKYNVRLKDKFMVNNAYRCLFRCHTYHLNKKKVL